MIGKDGEYRENHSLCILWYAACESSGCNLEDMMQERGIVLDYATISR